MTDKHVDKGKGRMKEAAGSLTGDTSLKNEGRAPTSHEAFHRETTAGDRGQAAISRCAWPMLTWRVVDSHPACGPK